MSLQASLGFTGLTFSGLCSPLTRPCSSSEDLRVSTGRQVAAQTKTWKFRMNRKGGPRTGGRKPEDRGYLAGDPLPVAAVEVAGMRTLLAVPALLEGRVIHIALTGHILYYVDDLRAQMLPFGEMVENLRRISWICNLFAVPSHDFSSKQVS